MYLSIYLFIYLSFCKLENEAILRDCLSFETWQHQKRQQFNETSPILSLDNIKNEAILRDFVIFLSRQHQKRSTSARVPSKMESCVQR